MLDFVVNPTIIPICLSDSCLRTSLSRVHVFFRFSIRRQRGESPHKSRVYREIRAIRPSTNIVIWEMNGRALNKHAVVATADRTWSYSRARTCKWQRPPASASAEIVRCGVFLRRNSKFLARLSTVSLRGKHLFIKFRRSPFLRLLFLSRLNKRFERTGKSDRFDE